MKALERKIVRREERDLDRKGIWYRRRFYVFLQDKKRRNISD